jgi:transcriptional regulator of arginine metabolism
MNKHASGDAARRRDLISEIIRSSSVHSQEELQALLRRRGMRVTQPTLSRDLRELGVAKSPAGYVLASAMTSASNIAAFTPRETREERLNRLVRSSVLSADAAMNLVVIKTPIADAQPLASALDAAQLDDVLGTIGGDDTIFVALANPTAAASLAAHFRTVAGIAPARRRTRA